MITAYLKNKRRLSISFKKVKTNLVKNFSLGPSAFNPDPGEQSGVH